MDFNLTPRDLADQIVKGVGGFEDLKSLLVEFYTLQAHDILVGFFFEGRDVTEIAHRQAVFMTRLAGQALPADLATSTPASKAPAQAHDALAPILEGHLSRRAVLLRECLQARGVAPEIQAAWLALEARFHAAILAHSARP